MTRSQSHEPGILIHLPSDIVATDPAQLAHAINEAKTKVDELVKRVEEA